MKKLLSLILLAAIAAAGYYIWTLVQQNEAAKEGSMLPQFGKMLPGPSDNDGAVIVNTGDLGSKAGTAFAIGNKGRWVTARHVVDGCDDLTLRSAGRSAEVTAVKTSLNHDTAVLTATVSGEPLPTALDERRKIGDYGYIFGFPQGQPGEIVVRLIDRKRLIARGRYDSVESALAWMEAGRSDDLKGTLQGLSGAPVLNSDGRVIGVFSVEALREDRILSVAPENLKKIIPVSPASRPEPISRDRLQRQAHKYRRDGRIVEVFCKI